MTRFWLLDDGDNWHLTQQISTVRYQHTNSLALLIADRSAVCVRADKSGQDISAVHGCVEQGHSETRPLHAAKRDTIEETPPGGQALAGRRKQQLGTTSASIFASMARLLSSAQDS